MWGVTWVERRSQLWIEVCLGLLPHICLLPKTLASGLKAGPHQATSTPRFIDFRPCLYLPSNCHRPYPCWLTEAKSWCPCSL